MDSCFRRNDKYCFRNRNYMISAILQRPLRIIVMAQQTSKRPVKATDPAWAWAAYKPSDSAPWNLARAGHLYRRAGFGANWGELQQALSDGPQRTIDKLLKPKIDPASFNRELDQYESSASVDGLRAWWLRRMIQTPHPLLEKMTLFWHSHFAADAAKVKSARLMQQNVQFLRSQALGSLRTMLEGIWRDPAMLLSAAADTNRKARPNENFAKSLFEVFTVGPGGYTERDVREASRAFTGWFVLRSRLRYIEREHDDGAKQIFGRQGKFKGDDVVRVVLEQPATAQRLVRKLYRFFISETEEPDARVLAAPAESFAKDYDIPKLVGTVLRSNLFFSPAAYHQRAKSPIDFSLGIIKGLEETVSTTQLAQDLAALGQNLYHPPTIHGWSGGRHWLNSSTMAARSNLALALLQGSGPYGAKLNPWLITQKYGASTVESTARFLVELFLQADPEGVVYRTLLKSAQSPADAKPQDRLRRFAHSVTTVAEFNLA